MSCPYTYVLNLTGDCTSSNSGALQLLISGTAPLPAYTLQWNFPYTSGITLPSSAYTINNLSGGSYSFTLTDNCSPPGPPQTVNFRISTGTCVSISSVQKTTCGQDNGALTATTEYLIGSPTFYLYTIDSNFVTSASSVTQNAVFSNLSGGTYYVVANDGGGCTGRSETVVVKSSTTLNYDLYVVENSGCFGANGKVFINNIVGYPPYTYLWSNGQTTSSITGLSPGNYSVTVTDSTGCQISKITTVGTVPSINLANTQITAPSCFASDGQLTITITGGTAPYTYSGSNGVIESTYSPVYTFSGVGQGNFGISITDAGLCNYLTYVQISVPNSFNIVSINKTNVTCGTPTGSLSVVINGATPPYTYTLTYPDSSTSTQTIPTTSAQFNSLSAGTYTLSISNSGPCVFTNTYTISSTTTYDFTTTTTGTTCGLNNGKVTINLTTGGTPPYTYQVTGQPTVVTGNTSYTFTSLPSGLYSVIVTDGLGCQVTDQFTISAKTNLDFTLIGTNPISTNNGSITAYITTGEPTFTLNWSSNVNGQTGLTVNNLSAGTYTLSITDSDGCTLERQVVLIGFESLVSYQIYNVCDGQFENDGLTIIKKPQQMFLEGYYDLTSGETGCYLNQAIFTAEVTVGGTSSSIDYFTSSSLGEYPSDNQWYSAVESLLILYPQIGNVTFSTSQNLITIESKCSQEALLTADTSVVIDFKISYDITCLCPNPVVPGPYIPQCDMIYNSQGLMFSAYTYSTNSSVSITVPSYTFDSPSVVHTQNYLFAIQPVTGGAVLYKWQIALGGFIAGFIGTISISTPLSGSIAAKDDTTIIGVNTGTTPSTICEINVNSGVVTNKFTIGLNREVEGTMFLTTTNNKLYLFNFDVSNAPFYNYFYSQYDYISELLDFEFNTSALITTFAGQFGDGPNLYLVDKGQNIFQVIPTIPYLNLVNNIGAPNSLISISQIRNCLNPTLDLNSCMSTCDVFFIGNDTQNLINYDPVLNTYETFPKPVEIVDIVYGFIKNQNKAWYLTPNNIFEYDVYDNCPVWFSYNRTIPAPFSLFNGFSYIDSNTLVVATVTTVPPSLFTLNLTTNTFTTLFPLSTLPIFRVPQEILVTATGKFLITNFDSNDWYLTQYSATGTIEVDILLPSIPVNGYNVWVTQGQIYVSEGFNNLVYNVNPITHAVTPNYTLSFGESVKGSQFRDCVNVELVP